VRACRFAARLLLSTALGTGRRGAFTLSLSNVPTRRASETVGSYSFLKRKKKRKIVKNFLTQMAALVVVNSDCSKLSKAAIKKAIRNKLTTNTIYKFWETKAIPVDT
jgi:hypothetical protein